jgi:DNA-binding CsgD family transcriptional regulator
MLYSNSSAVLALIWSQPCFLYCVHGADREIVAVSPENLVELVQSLFDLTPTEARVARSIASGRTAEDIAEDGGVSLNTVRTHVRGVLEKTGCNRQADLVALLTGLRQPPPA